MGATAGWAGCRWVSAFPVAVLDVLGSRVPFSKNECSSCTFWLKRSPFNGEAGPPLVCGCTEGEHEGLGLALCRVPSPRSGHCLCSGGRRLPGRGSAFEAARSNGVGMGYLLASELFSFPSLEGVLCVQKLEGREGRRERVFCPIRLQQLSLSAQPQSSSSPASPVNLATGAHTSYLRVPRRAGSNTWEQFKGWTPGCADCRRHSDGSPATPAAPGATALGLRQPLLVLPLICSTLSFLLQLIFSSDLPGTGPYLIWEKQCHVTSRELF